MADPGEARWLDPASGEVTNTTMAAIYDSLRLFIEPHPHLHPDAGEIFTPKQGHGIRFFFEGGTTVLGYGPEMEVNFNDDDLLVLATSTSVYRFRRECLLGFELVLPTDASVPTREHRGLRLVKR